MTTSKLTHAEIKLAYEVDDVEPLKQTYAAYYIQPTRVDLHATSANPTPFAIVRGPRIRKDGSLGRPCGVGFLRRELGAAPQWLLDLIATATAQMQAGLAAQAAR